MPEIRVARVLDRGLKRHRNEDYLRTAQLSHGAWLLIVADGMGGHSYGAECSRAAADGMANYIINNNHLASALADGDIVEVEGQLLAGAWEANDQAYEAAMDHNSVGDMGSTLLAAILLPSGQFGLVWVGDSRGYKISTDALVHLHYVHNYASEMLEHGVFEGTEDEAKKTRGSNILTRSLGRSRGKLRQDGGPGHISAKLQPGERLLLCSDGIWGELPDEILRVSVAYADTPTTACSALLAAAYDRGAEDNISAIVAELK